LVAIAINVLALNIFEYQIGLSCLRHAGINQFGDVGMSEACENVALAFESFLPASANKCDAEKLDGHLSLEMSIAAFS
jgi:hypothetical protein